MQRISTLAVNPHPEACPAVVLQHYCRRWLGSCNRWSRWKLLSISACTFAAEQDAAVAEAPSAAQQDAYAVVIAALRNLQHLTRLCIDMVDLDEASAVGLSKMTQLQGLELQMCGAAQQPGHDALPLGCRIR